MRILRPFDDFQWTDLERQKILSALVDSVGAPYKLGSKWPDCEPNPQGPVDCSGLVRWAFSLCGLFLPQGSYEQVKVAKPCGDWLAPLCVGFADLHPPKSIVDHVNIVLDNKNVIEARADYGKVVLRPIAKWEAQQGFLGWHYFEGTVDHGS